MTLHGTSGIAAWVESMIKGFLDLPSENLLRPDSAEKAWGEPLVGYSQGNDLLFVALKEHIGPFYWTPAEIFNITFRDCRAVPEDLSVICWILPQTPLTREDNRKETLYPSERWARTRAFGEEINTRLKNHVVSSLREAGYDAVAPTLSPAWSWQDSQTHSFASNWSDRHAAYVSGLGTFGLCDGLITPFGKAVRIGSVVARLRVAPTQRPYSTHTEYCLFFSGGSCRKCMSRCPAGAITEAGHDKAGCFEYMMNTSLPYIRSRYGFDGYSCGLCQTGVPCESGIPLPEEKP